ncbi:polysaccharide deacetylase family protein [Paenibacillus sp. N1-5-1-14]|uniref:polysaccharide deacetylase family protein n=1 Tax=Paenibacillus radicibacter TaxID=2972488 RepID=UPI002158D325|nr:polysaccharide deacetylase family protein [Paenibacillus radicibacter]MCR8643112.1 polysaccharide deacetylase family protein [Paenibacillus radicibacter]
MNKQLLVIMMGLGLLMMGMLGCQHVQKAKDQALDDLNKIPTPLASPSRSSIPLIPTHFPPIKIEKLPSPPSSLLKSRTHTITPKPIPSNPPQPKTKTLNKPSPSQLPNTPKGSHVRVRPYTNLSHTGKKIAYLTFDDGPSLTTIQVLDTLKKNNVHATFFVNGNDSALGIAMYKRMAKEGHAIGNHTYSHHYAAIYRSPKAYKRDVERLGKLLEQVVGYRPTIMRFPGGSNNTVSHRAGGPYIMNDITERMLADGYTYFDWNVDSEDASGRKMSSRDIYQSVRYYTAGQRRIIVLMHDAPGKQMTAEALPAIINYLRGQGYQFDVLRRSSSTYQFLRPYN